VVVTVLYFSALAYAVLVLGTNLHAIDLTTLRQALSW